MNPTTGVWLLMATGCSEVMGKKGGAEALPQEINRILSQARAGWATRKMADAIFLPKGEEKGNKTYRPDNKTKTALIINNDI